MSNKRRKQRKRKASGYIKNNTLLKSSLFGGYEKLGVIEYIEGLLQKAEEERSELNEQLEASRSLTESLAKENAFLKEELNSLKGKEKEIRERLAELSSMMTEAEKIKNDQLKEIQRERDRIIGRAQIEANEHAARQSRRVQTQAQQELNDLMSELTGFMKKSAQNYCNIFEELTESLDDLEEESAEDRYKAWLKKWNIGG